MRMDAPSGPAAGNKRLPDRGHPIHQRGVTGWPGLCFVRLTWQHTRDSALLASGKDDAESIAPQIDVGGLSSTLTAAHEVAADQIDLDGDVDDPAGGASTAHGKCAERQTGHRIPAEGAAEAAQSAGPGIAPSASLSRVQTFMLTTTPTISSVSSGPKCSTSASWKRWNAASRSVSAARVSASV